MAKDWKYGEGNKNIILSESPKQKLRITGHRIASVLGLNAYQTPFGAWAEITKLVKLPFEDNKYTIAGKILEPKLINLIKNDFPNAMSIEEYYGNNIEKYRWNNFVDDSNVFGGIIDAVATKNDLKTLTMIVECKTSSKPQLWENNQVPIEYLLQGCLYSYLKGLDRVLFICTFLQDSDYAHPEKFIPDETNTIMVVKKIKDVVIPMPDGSLISFEDAIKYCEDWWNKYIETGISPEFDEKKDKEYLNIIRESKPINDNDIVSLCNYCLACESRLDDLKKQYGIEDLEKEISTLKDSIKDGLKSQMGDNDDKASCGNYELSLSRKVKFDETKFKKENEKLYNNYLKNTETYTLRKKVDKEKGE